MSPADNIFALLDQNGPFATGDTPPSGARFSRENREIIRKIRSGGSLAHYRVFRNQIFEFLKVGGFSDIEKLLHDKSLRKGINERAYKLLGNMFGIEGIDREIISRVDGYSQTADGVIRYLRNKVLANYASHIEITNEIDIAVSPVDLLLITYDGRYHKKARFEAKRKLLLMLLAGSIDQRERETDIGAKFADFLSFLNDYVWSKSNLIGELNPVYLLSHHDSADFACRDLRIISPREAAEVAPKKGLKLTLLKRRSFLANGREIPIYVSIRKKPPEAKVLKLLRKNEENPAVAVDDELGLMGVVDSVMEVKIFQKHLTESAISADSFMTLEEVSDTLSGGSHRSSNHGSSAKTSMLKFFAKMSGMRVEFIIHTNESYLNYMYQKDVAHDEYEVKRIFDSGVAELLFPGEIYYLDMKKAKEKLIRWFRCRIEEF
ncbi:MAG: hypothetical protein RQ753_09120 [Desulfurivibrionaceae bacterium]|nr:hypothetical protein [Desulfobulbales bacterium]MDT8335847.1 hypothetical protein [Desulfurivibrionaceae bacterium]